MDDSEFMEKQVEVAQNGQDINFLQHAQKNYEGGILNQHLDATHLLEYIEKILMGYEYDTITEEYKKARIEVPDGTGKMVDVEQGSLMDPVAIRMSIAYLKGFLDTNTFLSSIRDPIIINNKMWDVNLTLTKLLHPLKKKVGEINVHMIYKILEHNIEMSLYRSVETLKAMTKMQHSIEHVTTGSENQKPITNNKQFKMFGF